MYLTRKSVYFTLAGLILLALAGGYVANTLHRTVRSLTLSELKKNFNYPVKISAVEGDLLTGVSLKDLVILNDKKAGYYDEILRADQLKVHYSLSNLLFSPKGKKRIELELVHPRINVEHYRDDTFNLLKMLHVQPQPANQKFPWDLRLKVRNAELAYLDQRGFGSNPLPESVINSARNVNLDADFDGNTFNLIASGKILDLIGAKPFKLRGAFDSKKNKFQLVLTSAGLDGAKWTNYIIPLPGIQIMEGTGRVVLGISSRTTPAKPGDLPFDLKVWVNAAALTLRLPWIRPEITQASGRILITNDFVRFVGVKGRAGSTPFVLDGKLSDFANLHEDFDIRADRIDLKNAAEFFPFFSKWNLKGIGSLTCRVKNINTVVPVISGTLNVASANVYGYPLSQLTGSYEYRDQHLGVSLNQGVFYTGAVKALGDIDLTGTTARIHARGTMTSVDMHQLFRNSSLFEGHSDAVFDLDGVPDDLQVRTTLMPQGFYFIGQPVNTAYIDSRYLAGVIDFQTVSINGTEAQTIQGTGHLYADKTFDAKVLLNNVYVDNQHFSQETLGSTWGRLSGSLEVGGTWCDRFSEDPLQYTRAGASYSITDLHVGGQAFSGLNGSLRIVDQRLMLSDLYLHGPDGQLNADVVLDREGVQSGRLSARDFNVAHYTQLLARIPDQYRSLVASAAFSLDFMRKSTAASTESFFSRYDIDGTLAASRLIYRKQPLQDLSFAYHWDGQVFNLSNILLHEGYSTVTGDGYISAARGFRFNFGSEHVLLDDFMPLTRGYGNIGGNGALSGTIFGTTTSWNIDSNFDLTSLRYNTVLLDRVSGHLTKTDQAYTLRPLLVVYKKNKYDLAGNFLLAKPLKYNLLFEVQNSELSELLKLVTMIRNEYQQKGGGMMTSQDTHQSTNLAELLSIGERAPFSNRGVLYDTTTTNILARFQAIRNRSLQSIREQDGLTETLGGHLSGKLQVSNFSGSLRINSDLEVKQGHISSLTFDRFNANIQTRDNQIHSLVTFKQGQIVDGDYDEIAADLVLDNANMLHINRMSMAALGQPAEPILEGTMPLGEYLGQPERRQIDINVTLKKNNINLLALFNRNVKWIHNQGDVLFHIGGPVSRPVLEGRSIRLQDAELKLVDDLYIKSALLIPDAEILLHHNVFSFKDLSVIWEGKDTFKVRNNLLLNGSVGLRELSFATFDHLFVDFDVKLSKTLLKVNFPDLYMGELSLANTTFKGPLTIALSKAAKQDYDDRITRENETGPLLKSDVVVSNGDFPLPDNLPPKRKPSILFNLNVQIGKDLVVSGGDFSSGTLTRLVNNINIRVQETKTPLYVHGSINTIIIDGSVNLDTGEVVFLNKGFTLMPLVNQGSYLDKTLTKQNSVDFVMVFDEEQNRRRIRPLFHIVANNDFEQTTANALEPDKKTVDKFSLLFVWNGYISDPAAMSMYLYSMNTLPPKLMNGYPYVVGRLTYDQLQDLYKYLFPELLKPEFYSQIFSSGLQNSQTQQVIRDITQKQINTALSQQIRPIERDLADKIGLYDLKFDYNLGQTINDAVLGKSQPDPQQPQDSKVLGVDVAFKVFVDRLFVRIKTQLDQSQNSSNLKLNLSEYELSLAILEWLSLNYTNRLNTTNDLTNTSRGGFSLDALYNF